MQKRVPSGVGEPPGKPREKAVSSQRERPERLRPDGLAVFVKSAKAIQRGLTAVDHLFPASRRALADETNELVRKSSSGRNLLAPRFFVAVKRGNDTMLSSSGLASFDLARSDLAGLLALLQQPRWLVLDRNRGSGLVDHRGSQLLIEAQADGVARARYPGNVSAISRSNNFPEATHQHPPRSVLSYSWVHLQVIQPHARSATKGGVTEVIQGEPNGWARVTTEGDEGSRLWAEQVPADHLFTGAQIAREATQLPVEFVFCAHQHQYLVRVSHCLLTHLHFPVSSKCCHLLGSATELAV